MKSFINTLAICAGFSIGITCGVFIDNRAASIGQANSPPSSFTKPVSKVMALNPLSRRSLGICNVSAYCPCEECCGPWAKAGHNSLGQRVSSSQKVIRRGTKFVAAPSRFEFGTKLEIPGYGTTTIEDRGGTIKGDKLDVLFFEKSPDERSDLEYSHQLALNWGRQFIEVFILE